MPVVVDKTEKGACIAFLGITLDTIKMEARLPQDKLDKCLALVKEPGPHLGEPTGKPYWASEFCLSSSGPQQAIPTEVIQPQGGNEEAPTSLQTLTVSWHTTGPSHLGVLLVPV